MCIRDRPEAVAKCLQRSYALAAIHVRRWPNGASRESRHTWPHPKRGNPSRGEAGGPLTRQRCWDAMLARCS
eukprot:7333662-Alexandrium_andersonii.AAC.1